MPSEVSKNAPGVSFDPTGPNRKNFPARSDQGGPIGAVTTDVAVELSVPEFKTGLRSLPAFSALMAVPETTMDQDNGTVAWEHDVRGAGKVSPVQPEAKTFAKEHGADQSFRPGIAAFDRGHHP